MHVENLASILTEVDSGEVQDQLDERLQAFSEGEIDHASDAFSSLWTRLTRDGGGKTPRCTGSSIVRLWFLRKSLVLISSTAIGSPFVSCITTAKYCLD